MTQKSTKIFISSTERDLDIAKDLAKRLQKIGFRVFTDEDAKTRDKKGRRTIDRGLRHLRISDEILLLLTENGIASDKVIFDIGGAFALHKKITPVVVGVDVDKLPVMVKHLPHIRYAELEDYLAVLKQGVEAPKKVYN